MKRQSILCPNCRLLISASEPRCPHCGLGAPGARWRQLAIFKLLVDPGLLVKTVLGANIAMFVLAIVLDPRPIGLTMNPLMFLSPSTNSLFMLGATGTAPINEYHRWWTLISASYLHSGILHILFNMAAFRQLAAVVVREYGTSRMFVLFTLGGIAGFVLSYLVGVPLTIGASAGVCGLVGSILYFGKSRGGSYGTALYKQVGMWVLIMFIFGILVPGINNWGHAGGIAAGAALGYWMGYSDRRRESAAHRLLARLCLVATTLVLVWAVGSALYYRFF
jgi:rhomboid protease GluP